MVNGRTSELKYLNTHYDRAGSQIMVVYGQKNSGKTAVLKQFVQDKPYYYYKARPASLREQLFLWGNELSINGSKVSKYPSYTEIFESVMLGSGSKKAIIIDEFQYIVKTGSDFINELITFVHDFRQSTQVMIILCSSSIGWVENSMVNKIGEAAYELSGFLKIKELDFEALVENFPGFGMEENIEAYAVLGGVPGLWKHFNGKLSIKDNICKNILNSSAYLYEEGERIVEEELRETSVYNTILASIASGHHKLNDLYLHTGFSRAKISVYIKNLMELELVEKVFSFDTEGKANVQKGIYRISNHFVHFYFTFLYPNLSNLESMIPAEFYKKLVEPYFKAYVGEYFKQVCTQRMEKWNKWGRLPIVYEKCSEWVGKLGTIDIIATNDAGETIIGLCSWEKPIMCYDDYEWLLFCADKAKIRADYIYLFSIHRFDEKLNLEAKVKQNLRLISVDEI